MKAALAFELKEKLGIEEIEQIRKSEHRLPIIAMTAQAIGTFVHVADFDPASNGTELYVVTGQSPRQLDLNITTVGRVIVGSCDDRVDNDAKGLENARVLLGDGSFLGIHEARVGEDGTFTPVTVQPAKLWMLAWSRPVVTACSLGPK